MAKATRIAGFDMGTSGLKVALADPGTGKISETKTYGYPGLDRYPSGVVPADLYQDTVAAVLKELTAEFELISMSVETQLYSICGMMDGKEWVFQWNSSCEPSADPDIAEELRKSGCRLHPLFGAYKAAAFSGNDHIRFMPYGLKASMIRFLTGEPVADYSTASSIGLLNVKKLTWNKLPERLFGISTADMPRLCRHDEPCGTLKPVFFAESPSSTVVVPGLGDGPSASYACREVSRFCGNLGTSMAARVLTDGMADIADDGLFRQAVDENSMIIGGISPNGCSVFSAMEDLKPGKLPLHHHDGPLLFMPWIHGEMTPYWSAELKPVFLGGGIPADVGEIQLAITKSVAFSFASIVREVRKNSGIKDPLLLAGGGTNNRLLMEIIGGCVEGEIWIPEHADYLAATGAVMSAARGAGLCLTPAVAIRETLKGTSDHLEEYAQWLAAAEKTAGMYGEESK